MTDAFYVPARTAEDRLVKRIKALEARLDGMARTPQLTSSSLDDGALTVTSDGAVAGVIGLQFDGSNGYVALTGPTPPAPSAPDVITVVGGVKVLWNGQFPSQAGFTNPVVAPQDFLRVDVEVSADPSFVDHVDITDPNNGSIPSASGGEVTVAWPNPGTPLYARLLTRTTAGKRSAPSVITGPIESGKVGLGDLGFDLGTYVASNTVLYGPTAPDPAGDATRRIGTLWLKELAANQYETWRWTGAAWVFVQDQGITSSLVAAAQAQTTADAKAAVFPQATPPAYSGAANTAVWRDIDDGNRLYDWSTTSTIERRNYALNPSFEYDAPGSVSSFTGWTNFSSGTTGVINRTVATGGAISGAQYATLSAAGLGGGTGDRFGFSQDVRCLPGDVLRVRASAWVTVVDTTRPIMVGVYPMTTDGTFLPNTATFGTGSAGTQTIVVTSAAMPATTAKARIYVWRQGNAGTGTLNVDLNVDSVLAELNRPAGAATTYFDGSTGTPAFWESTPHLSASRTTQTVTAGTLAWVPRQLGNGAFQTNSLVASNVVATGTVSAALLEALMVLVTAIVAGNPNADHARLEPTGLRVYNGLSGGGVAEAIRMGTNTNDFFGIFNSLGRIVAAIDDTGAGRFDDLTINKDPQFQGTSLADMLSPMSNSGLGNPTVPKGGQTTVGWVDASIAGVTTEFGLTEVAVQARNDRTYLIGYEASGSRGVGSEVRFRIRDGGTGTPTLSSTQIMFNQHSEGVETWDQRFQKFGLWQPTTTGTHRLLLTAAAQDASHNVSFSSITSLHAIYCLDLGPKFTVSAQVNRGAGGTANPPQSIYTGDIAPSEFHSYRGDDTLRTDNTTDVIQGWDSGGVNGDGKGHWRFPLPSITGTVDRVDFYVNTRWTSFTSGGTGIWNISNGVAVANPTKLQADHIVGGYPKPGTKTITLPSAWNTSFKNKTAITVTAGPSGSTNLSQACWFEGATARLRVWYTQ